MENKYYIVLIVIILVSSIGLYFMFSEGSNGIDNNGENGDQLTAMDLYQNHEKQLEEIENYQRITFSIIEDETGDIYNRNTEFWANQNEYFILNQNSNQGTFILYSNFDNENRLYTTIQTLGVSYYETIDQNEFEQNNKGHNSLEKFHISEEEQFDSSELEHVDIEYNEEYVEEDIVVDEFLTTEYNGTKYDDLSANFLVHQDESLAFIHIRVEQDGKSADITQEYVYNDIEIDSQQYSWIHNAVSKEEATTELEEFLEIEFTEDNEINEFIQD